MNVSEYAKPALRTAIYFFIFGFLWVLLSDFLAHEISVSHKMEHNLQTYKGAFFILITTLLIYLFVKRQVKLVMELQNRLDKSEHRFMKIASTTKDLIWTTDKNGVITYINEGSKDVFGFSPKEMIGKKFLKFVETEQYYKNLELFAKELKKGHHSIVFETTILHRSGRKIYLRDTVTAIFDNNNEVKLLEGTSTNITDYKQYEQQLLENKQRLELAMHGGEIGLWDFWFNSQKLSINNRWKEILGIHLEEDAIDMDLFYSLVHPDDITNLKKAFKVPSGKMDKFIEVEYRMRNAEGAYCWITSKGKVAEYKNDKPIRLMGAIIDSTEKKKLEIELKNLVKLYRSFISYSSEGIYLFEMNVPMPISLPIEEQIGQLYHNGYIRTCNDAFAKIYGYETGEQMVGTKQETLHGNDSDPENIELLRRFINSGYRMLNDITKEIDKNGETLYISNNVVGIIENGMLLRTWGSQSDITAQVVAQQKIEQAEKHYRLLFETNPVPLVIFDDKTFTFLDVNQEVETLFGYSKEELLGMNIRDLRPDISEYPNSQLQEMVQREISQTTELNLQKKSGEIIPCEVKLDRIKFKGSSAFFGAATDMSNIKNAEKMVIQSLIEGADNERARVAKELHDGLGQNLTAASLNLNSLNSDIKLLGEKNVEKFQNGIRFLKSAIEESRNIAHNLMPKAIEDFGIVLSLKSLFNQIEKSADLKIKFYQNIGEKIRLDIQVELNIYRVTQEAINNVIKHAEASEVFVQLMLYATEIIYTFEDNGKGFEHLVVNSGKKGIGIKSMYNRAMAMSGHCDVESSKDEGTTITIVIPIER